MRGIHVIVPVDKENMITTILENLKVFYEKIVGKDKVLIIISVEDEYVETVIDAIKKVGVGTLYGTYQVYNLEFAARTTEPFIKRGAKRVSREEILSDIRDQAEFNRTYALSCILAAVLATLGLLTDNVIITIASMIIAPLIGPILGTSLGIVLNIDDLRRESIRSEIAGLLLAILTGFVFTMMLPYTNPTSEVLARAHPTYVDIIFAVVAGVAAAISIVSIAPVALVGVAIAASIIPPAVNIGIGFAFYLKGVEGACAIIYGSTILLVINVLAINSMSILFFWLVGIKPGESIRKELIAKRIARERLVGLIFAFLVVSAPIIYATISHYEEKRIENEIRMSIIAYMSKYHPDIEIVNLDIVYSKQANTAYIYLTIGVSSFNDSIISLASEIKQYVAEKFHIKAKVYLSINIISSYVHIQ